MPESGLGGCGSFDKGGSGVGCAFDTCGEGLIDGTFDACDDATGSASLDFGSSASCLAGCSGTLTGTGSAGLAGEGATGCATVTAGDDAALVLIPPGGGGSGAIPTPFLSLAAAAAAAEAYFKGWPVGIVGKGAGFMDSAALLLELLGVLCNVASGGRGCDVDFSCTLGRLVVVSDVDLGFVAGFLGCDPSSASGGSSCML